MPASRAARLASFGISMPMISSAGETMRALMPADQALVLGGHLDRVGHVHARLRDDVGQRGQAGLADVQERIDLGRAVRQDVLPAAEGGRARAAASTMVVTPE
jgi:hypothetical protein